MRMHINSSKTNSQKLDAEHLPNSSFADCIKLPVTNLQFTLIPLGDYENLSQREIAPLAASNIWRGVIGNALREQHCVTGELSCEGCGYIHTCLYGSIYESRPVSNSHPYSKLKSIPHPYTIRSQTIKDQPGLIRLTVTLIGKLSILNMSYLIEAVASAAHQGIGKTNNRIAFGIKKIHQFEPNGKPKTIWDIRTPVPPAELQRNLLQIEDSWSAKMPPSPQTLTLEILSPLRIIRRGKLVTPANIEFQHIFSTAIRRISSLCAFYGEPVPLSDNEFSYLTRSSETINKLPHSTLSLTYSSRYSARQKKRTPLDGLTGKVEFFGDNLDAYWPIIWLSQWVHIGKGTTNGLGYFRVIDT